MKVKFIKPVGSFADYDQIGEIHLIGVIDSTACGIANEDWEGEPTNKPITCVTCLDFLEWAKKVSKIKN